MRTFGRIVRIQLAALAMVMVAVTVGAQPALAHNEAGIPLHLSRPGSCYIGQVELPTPSKVLSYAGGTAKELVYWEAVLELVGSPSTYYRQTNRLGQDLWAVVQANGYNLQPWKIYGIYAQTPALVYAFADASYLPTITTQSQLMYGATFQGLARGTYRVWNHYAWWTGTTWVHHWELGYFNNVGGYTCTF